LPPDEEIIGGDKFPGSQAPIIVGGDDAKSLIQARWGLQPFWAKDPHFGRKNAYNARSETITEKPTFRTAFKKQRCIVPATSFYERAGGRWLKISAVDGGVLPIAGLFEVPNSMSETATYTLVTTVPNDLVADAHDRMPVILAPDQIDEWLSLSTPAADLLSQLIPCPAAWLVMADAGPVSRKAT